jgi:hypothetical protein
VNKDPRDWCQERGCRAPSDVIYRGRGLCDRHWVALCAKQERNTRVTTAGGEPVAAAPGPGAVLPGLQRSGSGESPQIGMLFDVRV